MSLNKFKIIQIVLLILFTIKSSDLVGDDKNKKKEKSNTLTILAVGDINLGRKVGQRLIKKEYSYPFEKVKDTLKTFDIIFGNLESQLSDQNGQTQNPKHNLIFTGPPEGAISLEENGITVVSTANNHAFDYGKAAFLETIDNLKERNIAFCGSSKEEDSCYLPVIIEKNDFKIAFFAVTDIINMWKKDWKGLLAFADTSKLFPQIRSVRPLVDLVIVSYHGGNEYVDYPVKKTVNFAHLAIDSGKIDLFLGHHPHVTQGIELYNNKYIFYSLGNFVFYQPQKFWTQKTFAVNLEFIRNGRTTELKKFDLLPASAGLQPYFYKKSDNNDKENGYDLVISRVKKLSPTIKWEN